MTAVGRQVYGLIAIALGSVGLIWGHFIKPWQAVPDDFPGVVALACACALVMIACGLGLQWNRSALFAGTGLAAIFGVFASLWIARVIGAPTVFAYWSGLGEETVLLIGAVLAAACGPPHGDKQHRRVIAVCRVGLGLCLLAFGTAHFVYVKETSAMVPAWVPPGQKPWAYLTGAAHVFAGLALISNIQATLAAGLVTTMFGLFESLVWLPMLISNPTSQFSWGGNAVNLGLTASALLLAKSLRNERRQMLSVSA